MPAFAALPSREDIIQKYPEEVKKLNECITQRDFENFYTSAQSPEASDAMKVVARYASVGAVNAQLSNSAEPVAEQYIEDCVAERIWLSSLSLGKIDNKTKRLVKEHGFLGGMINQLKPTTKVGSGNFNELQKSGLVECTAEYCVWKWGRGYADPALMERLDALARQYNFQ